MNAFVYRAQRPFQPDRLWKVASSSISHLKAVVRAKGLVWLVSRPDRWGYWSQNPQSIDISGALRLQPGHPHGLVRQRTHLTRLRVVCCVRVSCVVCVFHRVCVCVCVSCFIVCVSCACFIGYCVCGS
jgi:hypothetical protein